MNSDWSKAVKAVEKLTDQSKLAEAAKNAPYSGARLVAVKKLTDQVTLANILKNEKDVDMRFAAANNITDLSLLLDIVHNVKDRDIRYVAIQRITDQAALAEIVRTIDNGWLMYDAFKKLTDQSLLAEIALTESNETVRTNAVEKLTDQSALARVAKKDTSWKIRELAAAKITDQSLLAEIARNDSHHFVRTAAAQRLSAPRILVELLWNDESDWVQSAACERLFSPPIFDKTAVDVNARDEDGNTLLHKYAKISSNKLCKALVEHNADKTSKNNEGLTPAELATDDTALMLYLYTEAIDPCLMLDLLFKEILKTDAADCTVYTDFFNEYFDITAIHICVKYLAPPKPNDSVKDKERLLNCGNPYTHYYYGYKKDTAEAYFGGLLKSNLPRDVVGNIINLLGEKADTSVVFNGHICEDDASVTNYSYEELRKLAKEKAADFQPYNPDFYKELLKQP